MGKVCSLFSRRSNSVRDSASTVGGTSLRADLVCSGSDIQVILNGSEVSLPSDANTSVLSGRRRSLLVGINYYDTRHELHGGVNDVKRILPLLAAVGFESDSENQMVLTDAPDHSPEQRPTRDNILKGLNWLAENAQPGDALFFHFSGHGGRENHEVGGQLHETLVPVDFESASLISDKEIFDELVAKLPAGCRLTCLFDSYHGVEAPLALPFTLMVDSPTLQMAKDSRCPWTPNVKTRQTSPNRRTARGEILADVLMFTGCWLSPKSAQCTNTAEQCCLKPLRQNGSSFDSGSICLDQSRVAGGSNWGAGGALSSAFLELLRDLPSQPPALLTVLQKIRQHLKARSSAQAPLIAASRPFALKQIFGLDTRLLEW